MSRIRNPPKTAEKFIPTPTPGWKGARPRGGSEAYSRTVEKDNLDPRFKDTQPPKWWWSNHYPAFEMTDRAKARELVPVAPLDARAQRHVRRKLRK